MLGSKNQKAKKLAKEKKMKKMLRSSVVLMLAMAVGLMLNVGCEDSELSRLLGLSKKKNDSSAQQPQETSSQSAVENIEDSETTESSEVKESESKESDSQDGNLQQTQSDGNANGQVNNGESQTLQTVDIPQAQAPENVGGIQPDIAMPSGKNYIKVLQISGTKHPNDLGYAGTWEFFDPTPVGTERIKYGTSNPADIDEAGIWDFQMIHDGNVTVAFRESLTITFPNDFDLQIQSAVINAGVISVIFYFQYKSQTPFSSETGTIFRSTMVGAAHKYGYPVAGSVKFTDSFGFIPIPDEHVSWDLVMNIAGVVRLYGKDSLQPGSLYDGILSYPVAKNAQKDVIKRGEGISIVWIKTALADIPTYGRNNFWGRTK
jgi:hypothetical protein